MVASVRIRQHLRSPLRNLSAEVEKMDGSAESVHKHRDSLFGYNLGPISIDPEAHAYFYASTTWQPVEPLGVLFSRFGEVLSRD